MGWFFNSDDDNSNNDPNQKEKSTSYFRFGLNSVSRECRNDPQDNNFMICKVKETKTERINGKDVTKTDEREERVPVNENKNAHIFSNFSTNQRPFTSSFFNNLNSYQDDVGTMEDQFRNSLNNFFGNSFFIFDDIFREMDRNFQNFDGQQQSRSNQNQNYFNTNDKQKNEYNYQFRNNKSDKDIYDV